MGLLIRSAYLCILFKVLSVLAASGVDETARKKVIVDTTTGLVQGEQGGLLDSSGRPWYRFRGIPFAEPPVGVLRFEPPIPKLPWDGVLDASKKGDYCIQGSDPVEGSEDCLFVKIYTPETPDKTSKLPVLVWVYGGAFYMGAPDFDGGNPVTLLNEGIIVVSFHYRIGIFGFLSTEDLVAPGNVGLKDQIVALQWIKNNIENFGGDPERITLCGQSAGATSIAYILQAPQTKGLYSGVVMLSGGSLNSWALTRNPLDFAKTVASSLKVSTTSTREMVQGLKQLSAEEIQLATASSYSRAFMNDPTGGLPIGPVIEPENSEAVIVGSSHDLLQKGQFNEVPMIIGHTSLEAHTSEGISSSVRLLLTLYNLLPGRLVPIGMNVRSTLQRNTIGQSIRRHYFGSASITSSDSKALKMISEDQFVRGIYESVRLYSKKVPVYYYSFGHEGPLFGIQNRSLAGVGHNEDLGYFFDFGHSGSHIDYLVRDRFVRLISNFARSAHPTPIAEDLLQNINWIPNTGGSEIKQLNVTNRLEIVTNPYNADMVFWKNTFDQSGVPPFQTF